MVKRFRVDEGIPTLAMALAEHMNADELKVLASLTRSPTPTRKADLVEHILDFLEATGSGPSGNLCMRTRKPRSRRSSTRMERRSRLSASTPSTVGFSTSER